MLVGLALLGASAFAPTTVAAAEAPSHPLVGVVEGFLEELTLNPVPPPEGEFEDACGVAVDLFGDTYIADYYHHAIYVYSPQHEYMTQIADPSPDGPCNLAVDLSGRVYVNQWRRDVARFAPSEFPPTKETAYGPAETIDSGGSTGVAFDPLTGDVYVDDRTYVAEYEAPIAAGGEPVRKFGLGSLGSGYGVAVSDFPVTEGYVYVPDAASGTVKAFDPSDPANPALVIDGRGTPQAGFRSLVDSDVAVDPGDGHLYVADNLEPLADHPAAAIDELNPAGEYRGQITQGVLDAEPTALAIDGLGNVYVSSGNDEMAYVEIFGPTGPAHRITIEKLGNGEGTVASEPAGIACGTRCAAEFNSGAEVTLVTELGPHTAFAGWSGGGCSGTSRVCHVSLDADREVTATFAAIPTRTLTLSRTGTGQGTVSSEPAGIDCPGTCDGEFDEGSTVTLTATPGPHDRFLGWSGCNAEATPDPAECRVTMNSAKSVSAEFEALPRHALSVALVGSGQGSVSSEPAGIDCGSACAAEFNAGGQVILRADSALGSAFGGWSVGGDATACPGTGPCQLNMGADATVSATFTAVGPPPPAARKAIHRTLAVSATGAGFGTVSSEPAGIDCGVSCAAVYGQGTRVVLSAQPSRGSALGGWSGCESVAGGRCTVALGEDRMVAVSFVPSTKRHRRHRHRHRRHAKPRRHDQGRDA